MSEPVEKTVKTSETIVSETVAAILSTKTMTDAAKLLNLGLSGLYARFDKYPEIRKAIDEIPQKAIEIFKQNTIRATETIISDLDNRYNKFNAAKEILDRAGVGTKTGQQTNIQVNVSPIYGGKSVE